MNKGRSIPPEKRGMAVFSQRAQQRLQELRARKEELLNTLSAEECEELAWMEDYLKTRNEGK